MTIKEKEQMKEHEFLIEYIKFKNTAVQGEIFDIEEIKWLYEVYITYLK